MYLRNANAPRRWHFSFPAPMKIDQCFKIGYIHKPHGLKGEVTVGIDPDCPVEFEALETVFLEKGQVLVPYFIETLSVTGQKAIVKFEEVDDHSKAEYISKSGIYLPKSERPKSGRGEFYEDEIIGFEVHDTDLGVIGIVSELVAAGPNKLLSITSSTGNEILIPLNSPFIKSINKSKKTVSVELPEGYLEI